MKNFNLFALFTFGMVLGSLAHADTHLACRYQEGTKEVRMTFTYHLDAKGNYTVVAPKDAQKVDEYTTGNTPYVLQSLNAHHRWENSKDVENDGFYSATFDMGPSDPSIYTSKNGVKYVEIIGDDCCIQASLKLDIKSGLKKGFFNASSCGGGSMKSFVSCKEID